MGYIDDVRAKVETDFATADKDEIEAYLVSEIEALDVKLDNKYSVFGREVYEHPTLSSEASKMVGRSYENISQLVAMRAEIEEMIEELGRKHKVSDVFRVPEPKMFNCPECGAFVSLDDSFCKQCGDNLANLKRNYRMCGTCGSYLTADSLYCMVCGRKTTEIPIAKTIIPQGGDISRASGGSTDMGDDTVEIYIDGKSGKGYAHDTDVRTRGESDADDDAPTVYIPVDQVGHDAMPVGVVNNENLANDLFDDEAPTVYIGDDSGLKVSTTPVIDDETSSGASYTPRIIETEKPVYAPVRRFCPGCGAEIEAGLNVCASCGMILP